MAVEIAVENITPYLEKWEPQVFLSRKYKSQPALPIRGGWGYSEADAVVIDRVGEYWFDLSSFFGKYDNDEDAGRNGSRA